LVSLGVPNSFKGREVAYGTIRKSEKPVFRRRSCLVKYPEPQPI
jgi:hypothetical protein